MNKTKKDGKSGEGTRQYRLAHETLCITGINFGTKSIIGYVEMTIHPMRTDLRRIKVNSKQCRIYRISINDHKCDQFLYNDPSLDICPGEVRQRNLDYFETCCATAINAVDPNKGNGEITIRIPPEIFPQVQELKSLRVNIEFSLEDPAGGLQFVVPDTEGTLAERGAHLFTYGYENSSRLWFPCIDTYSELCTWKLEYTVPKNMTAVSCGDLIEIIYTADMKKKTFHYFLSTPTAAPNIAVAVGPFEVLVDPNMHEVTHFCLPHLMPCLKHSTAFLHEAFEFYEELLSSRYPYSCYKQVFVDQAFDNAQPFATMSILSTNLLNTPQIIDQTIESRKEMAISVAKQFFTCYIPMHNWCDSWLPKGIASYLCNQFIKRSLGNNQARHELAQDHKEVRNFEQNICGIVLDPTAHKESCTYFPVKHPHTVSPKYISVYTKKAALVMRMLELRLGRELLLQVFNKLLALASTAAQQRFANKTWSNMLLSTHSFQKTISLVTGKDIQPFLDQWVFQSGCARFVGNFIFNRKRNVVELELKQDMQAKGSMKYVGPLTVTIQELDGSFNHTFKIEENKTRFEITCHSKSRRNKKKKIPLMTGEEVDMDLSAMDADSPVLWLRVDPDMQLLRQVTWEQPDYMWQYQLKYERDVIAQSEAIVALKYFPTPATRMALTDTIENDHCFYKIRIEAAICLAKVANSMTASWAGPPAMMTIFRKMFGSHSCPTVIRQNNFTNFQNYYLQKTIPVAMAMLRDIHNICPIEVLVFLLDLFKYSDNSRNKYSDNYYRASLIDALANTITPAVTMVSLGGDGPSVDSLANESRLILDEVVRYLNMEKLLPCYHYVVTVSCLKAIRKLQKFGHLPSDASLFRSYATPGNFLTVRLAALEALVDFTKVEVSRKELDWLLRIVENDPEPRIRHSLVWMLIDNPPFTRSTSETNMLNSEDLVVKLWDLMCSGSSHDARLRGDLADFFFILYGRSNPNCLPIPESVMVLNLKEKKATICTTSTPSTAADITSDTTGINVPIKIEQSFVKEEKEIEMESLKRKIDSPPIFFDDIPMFSETVESNTVIPTTESKVRIMDTSELEIEIKSPPPEVAKPEILSPSKGDTAFTNEFLKFIKSPEQPAPLTNPIISRIQPDAVMSTDSLSRLSEDSIPSKPASPSAGSGQESQSSLPTSFAGQLFGTKPDDSSSKSKDGEKDRSKSHKSKKKKKKNKHKHKHKHKHDKGEKEKPKVLESFEFAQQFSEKSLNLSSGPSSPEFEVM